VRRRAAIDEIFHEDAVLYDPKGGIFRGRDEIDRIAGVIKAIHPDFEYQPLFPPEERALSVSRDMKRGTMLPIVMRFYRKINTLIERYEKTQQPLNRKLPEFAAQARA
jgi:hypothetical protein